MRGPIAHEKNVNNMTPVVYFLLHNILPSIKTSFSLVASSLQHYVCITSTRNDEEKSHNNDRSFPDLCSYQIVYLFVLGSFHTECVGEKTSSESKKEVAGKKPKTQPMKFDI